MAERGRIHAFEPYAALEAAADMAAPGVTLLPRRVQFMLDVRGSAEDAGSADSAAAHLALPRQPNTASDCGSSRVIWLGPNAWLVVSEDAAPDVFALVPQGAGTIVDVSHGRAALRLSGPDVRAALAKGCMLDLHPREFPVDRCAQTAIAKIPVILDHVEPDVFDLYCPRSYARSFWHWLTEACAEYGYRVARPQ